MAKLHDAARKCAVSVLQELVTSESIINDVDSEGLTPLMVAAQYGCIDGMKVLLNAGANVMAKDIIDRTALHLAVLSTHPEAIPLLAAYHADIDAKGMFGWTPSILASRQGAHDLLDLLLLAGATVDASDAGGWTALFHATWGNRTECIKRLINAGANPLQRSKTGWTVYHVAEARGLFDIDTLFCCDADPQLLFDNDGRAPQHYRGALADYKCSLLSNRRLQHHSHNKSEATWWSSTTGVSCSTSQDFAPVVTRVIGLGDVGERLALAVHDEGRTSGPDYGVIEYLTIACNITSDFSFADVGLALSVDLIVITGDFSLVVNRLSLQRILSRAPDNATIIVACRTNVSPAISTVDFIRRNSDAYCMSDCDSSTEDELVGAIHTLITFYMYRGLLSIDFNDVMCVTRKSGRFTYGSGIGATPEAAFAALIASGDTRIAMSNAKGVVITIWTGAISVGAYDRVLESTAPYIPNAAYLVDIKVDPELGPNYKICLVAMGL